MSKVFYWSDPHFGHDYVAKLRGFDSTEAHDNHIIDMWSSAVGKRDSIWLLGDLAMASPSNALAIIGALPGAKHLILGNHDSAHPMHRNAHRQQRRYLDVFDSVQSAARQKIQGQEFVLSHFPYSGDHAGTEDRSTQWRLRDEGLPLIHGHVHDEWLIRNAQINVGIDKWMDGPATSDEIIQTLND